MALIPPDVGIRMRMQTEANLLQPVAPAHEIASDLPELRTGQTFSARIQEVLPDNSYRALVAGKQLTLQLAEGAKTGDELELVVVDRTLRSIIAKPVSAPPLPATGEPVPYEFAKFSPAARSIAQLLPAEGEAPPPATLNRGQPLLVKPPQTRQAAVQLAPTLAKAVTQSGLFYESHQAQWATGQRPLAQLLLEPQGQHSAPGAFDHAATELTAQLSALQKPAAPNSFNTAGADQPQSSQPSSTLLQVPQTPAAAKVGAGETALAGQTAPSAAPSAATAATSALPDDLRPLVQQQLEAAASNRMVWHGEVWPQQTLDWEITRDDAHEGDGNTDDAAHWNTRLSLTTPRLGRIDARLQLSSDGVSITLATPYGASAADLRDEAPKLAGALDTAGVPLRNISIKHSDEKP